MKPTVVIEFCRTRRGRYQAALNVAGRLAPIEDVADGEMCLVSIALDVTTDLRSLRQLHDLVGQWRGTRVEVSTPYNELSLPALIRSIEKVRQCFSQRWPGPLAATYCAGRQSPDDDSPCFACRLLEGLSRLPDQQRDAVGWWNFGSLSSDLEAFHVDKPLILEYLRSRGRSQHCTLCPAFSWRAAETSISDLPDLVDLTDHSPFRIEYSQLDPLKPTGIGVRPSFTASPYL